LDIVDITRPEAENTEKGEEAEAEIAITPTGHQDQVMISTTEAERQATKSTAILKAAMVRIPSVVANSDSIQSDLSIRLLLV
jgi:hypothetical protein